MQDANYNVTGLLNAAGSVQERYAYDPYGTASIFDNAWVTRASSSFGWVYLHQGLRFDATTAKYYVRNREYDPQQGRWLTMDPLGFGAGDVNLYRGLGNNTITNSDSSGLQFPISDPAWENYRRVMTDEKEFNRVFNPPPTVIKKNDKSKSEGLANEAEFIRFAKSNKVSQEIIDTIIDSARAVDRDDQSPIFGNHDLCLQWVKQFEKTLNSSLIKLKGDTGTQGIKRREIMILDVPFGVEGNQAGNVFQRGPLSAIKLFVGTGGDLLQSMHEGTGQKTVLNDLFDQDHSTYKITFADDTVFYIDSGAIHRVRMKSAYGINDLKSPWRFTPLEKIPNGWIETKKIPRLRSEADGN